MAQLDILIVGAGFAGLYQLWNLRKEGYNVKVVEMGSDIGGVWYWNRYPGARVDSEIPQYELSLPEVWEDWEWSERFPGWEEILRYFDHMDQKLDLRKDCLFNMKVVSAEFDSESKTWAIHTQNGRTFHTQYFLLSAGFAAKRHIPEYKGAESFKGLTLHPSYWPHQGINLEDKRIALVGTGPTGVQIAEEAAKISKELVIFQRTPNFALPMTQKYYDKVTPFPKTGYSEHFQNRNHSFCGFSWDFVSRKALSHSPRQQLETFENLWTDGSLRFWLGGYKDLFFDEQTNRDAYNFWRDKTRLRVHDPKKREILIPSVMPYPFGTKRIALEQGYFEIFNQENVELVDLQSTPITHLTETGICTSEKDFEIDILILATGFDLITGSFNQIEIKGTAGELLSDKWSSGISTYLGMCASGFPNMFFQYGPQSPTSFCNGPTCAEAQGNWIKDCLNYMRDKGFSTIEPCAEAEGTWVELVSNLGEASLIPRSRTVS